MLQDREISPANHKRFVKHVAASGVVWGLRSDRRWAVSDSNEFQETDVIPFWSDRAYAARAAKDEWSTYEPTQIVLSEFIDTWLKGMNDHGFLVGTNWDGALRGLEVESAQLAKELLENVRQDVIPPGR